MSAPADIYRRPRAPVSVDCHVHLFPEKLFKAIREWFDGVGWKIPYPSPHAEVLAALRAFGVREAWALMYAHRPGVAEGLNAWMAGVARAEPMVRGFFTVHPADDDPLAIAKRAIDVHDLEGMKLHAEVQELGVDDPRLDGVFSLLEERGAPCVLHTGDAPYPYTKETLDVARVAGRLKKNPALKAVIAHLGANQTKQYLALTRDYPGLHLEVSFTSFPGSEQYGRLDFGSLAPYRDRLLFGSDFPNLTFTYADQADSWWDLDWVKEDAEQFFGGRARALLPKKK